MEGERILTSHGGITVAQPYTLGERMGERGGDITVKGSHRAGHHCKQYTPQGHIHSEIE